MVGKIGTNTPTIPTAREEVPMTTRIPLLTLLRVIPLDAELIRGAGVPPADSCGPCVAFVPLIANTEGIVPVLNARLKDGRVPAAVFPAPDGSLTGTCSMSVGGTT